MGGAGHKARDGEVEVMSNITKMKMVFLPLKTTFSLNMQSIYMREHPLRGILVVLPWGSLVPVPFHAVWLLISGGSSRRWCGGFVAFPQARHLAMGQLRSRSDVGRLRWGLAESLWPEDLL